MKIESKPPYYSEVTVFRCIECEGEVRVCSERKLTEAQEAELVARMLCTPCLNKKVGKK